MLAAVHTTEERLIAPRYMMQISARLALLRATAECFARLCHRLGVCLSVCLSVTLVICIKTVQARITKSSFYFLVTKFRAPGLVVPLERVRQRGVPPLKRGGTPLTHSLF